MFQRLCVLKGLSSDFAKVECERVGHMLHSHYSVIHDRFHPCHI